MHFIRCAKDSTPMFFSFSTKSIIPKIFELSSYVSPMCKSHKSKNVKSNFDLSSLGNQKEKPEEMSNHTFSGND